MATDGDGLDRRALLTSMGLTAAGALGGFAVAPRGAHAQADAPPSTPTPATSTFTVDAGPQFFADSVQNYGVLGALGGVAYQSAEVGEVMTTIARINARGATYPAYVEEFLATAAMVEGWSNDARRTGDKVTERATALRAAEYSALALFFALSMPNPKAFEVATFRRTNDRFTRAMRLMEPAGERLTIPYGRGHHIPGWLLRPRGPRRRRATIVFNNGSDAQMVEMWSAGIAAALERGYNAFVFDGPGQGAMLYLQKAYFTPEWQRVITPVVDALRAHELVDRRRMALWGWSFAGCLIPRALAHEHRLAAAVVDPGVTNYLAAWPAGLLATADGPKAEVDASFDRFLATTSENLRVFLQKRLEIFPTTSWQDAVRIMGEYVVTPEIASRVTTPMLITEAQGEQFWPGQSKTLYDGLTRVPTKKLAKFTAAAGGAQLHCEPMAPLRRNEVILDWLAHPSRLG